MFRSADTYRLLASACSATVPVALCDPPELLRGADRVPVGDQVRPGVEIGGDVETVDHGLERDRAIAVIDHVNCSQVLAEARLATSALAPAFSADTNVLLAAARMLTVPGPVVRACLIHAHVVDQHVVDRRRRRVRAGEPVSAHCLVQQDEEWVVVGPGRARRDVGRLMVRVMLVVVSR